MLLMHEEQLASWSFFTIMDAKRVWPILQANLWLKTAVVLF